MNFMKSILFSLIMVILTDFTNSLLSPNCTRTEIFEASSLDCRPCPANASMIASENGVSCICEGNSYLAKSGQCTPCNVTETVSADGSTCVPRKCQTYANRIVCRKCPKDNILLTQNHDGSPLKEVMCIKCARGYEARNNMCVKCESCICSKSEIIVTGKCLPKKYVVDRPKYLENQLHPSDLLEIVKNEYMCVINNVTACRWLAKACVGNFYSSDLAGPCRLWFYPSLVKHKFLPLLSANQSDHKEMDEIILSHGQVTISITAVSSNINGNFQYLSNSRKKTLSCFPPFNITIGENYSEDCIVNFSELSDTSNDNLLALYVFMRNKALPLFILLRKPNNNLAQKGMWPSNKFLKYFFFRRTLSPTSNMTNLIYLRSLLINVRVERKKSSAGSLKALLQIEAQYAVKSEASDMFVTSLKIVHDLPNAGVHSGVEVWGSILSVLMVVYAITQWRGTIRRGGLQISIIPISAGCIADALYFATWSSVIHVLAAEAGTLALTLPLSQSEEHLIQAMVYAVAVLKIIKAAYLNWNLCRSDMFLIDWSEYNPRRTDLPIYSQLNGKKRAILAKEWVSNLTKRRTSVEVNMILTLLILHLMAPWQTAVPKSRGYEWAISVVAWWSSYTIIFTSHMIKNKLFGCPSTVFPNLCVSAEFSFLVFQEDLYAHYVHGRTDDASESRYLSGPLSTCRVVCATQFRAICKQLMATEQCTYILSDDLRSTSGNLLKSCIFSDNLGKGDFKEDFKSRFLGAFFERVEYSDRNILMSSFWRYPALDGLSWVASERTALEKLLDIETLVREGGNTSVLLYDAESSKPSCFAVTWWGNEWMLATLDSMIFGSLLYASRNPIYAAMGTLIIYQITQSSVAWFGKENVKRKLNVDFI